MSSMKKAAEKSSVPVDPNRAPRSNPSPDQGNHYWAELPEDRTLGAFLWAVFDFQLRRLQKPLHRVVRYVIAFSGSLSLFLGFLVIESRRNLQEYRLAEYIFLDPGLGIGGSGRWITWLVIGVLSAFFAGLISVLPTRSGPVRLYLAGLFLPALSLTTIRCALG